MKKIYNTFKDSLLELKKLDCLAITALFIALAMVLGLVSIQITPNIKIGFSLMTVEFVGLLFGPTVGIIMGGITDIFKYFLNPTGPFHFGFTLNAMLYGMIFGLFLYKKPFNITRYIAAKLLVAVVIDVFLTRIWLSNLYGDSFIVILLSRIFKEMIMVPIEIFVFYSVYRSLQKIPIIRKYFTLSTVASNEQN